jgi:hypothetical protein
MDVFAYVIMLNLIQLLWCCNGLDKKETAQGSFLIVTAQEFNRLVKYNQEGLSKYAVNAINKKYAFWQLNSLAIHLHSR